MMEKLSEEGAHWIHKPMDIVNSLFGECLILSYYHFVEALRIITYIRLRYICSAPHTHIYVYIVTERRGAFHHLTVGRRDR